MKIIGVYGINQFFDYDKDHLKPMCMGPIYSDVIAKYNLKTPIYCGAHLMGLWDCKPPHSPPIIQAISKEKKAWQFFCHWLWKGNGTLCANVDEIMKKEKLKMYNIVEPIMSLHLQMPRYCENRNRLNLHMQLHKHLDKQKKELKKQSKYECIACSTKSLINSKFCLCK